MDVRLTQSKLRTSVGPGSSQLVINSPYFDVFRRTPSEQEITLGILKRFCAVDDTTLVEKVSAGPQNRLFLNGAVDKTFSRLLWRLNPTEVGTNYLRLSSPLPRVQLADVLRIRGLADMSRHQTATRSRAIMRRSVNM